MLPHWRARNTEPHASPAAARILTPELCVGLQVSGSAKFCVDGTVVRLNRKLDTDGLA